MNRKDLIDAISQSTNSSKSSTQLFLNSFVTHVQEAVANGEKVKLTGFGTFEKITVSSRPGRNPKTGASLLIPKKCRPKFTPGTFFKEIVKE